MSPRCVTQTSDFEDFLEHEGLNLLIQ